jgi:hypothetical protein
MEMDSLITTGAVGILCAYLLEAVKHSAWFPWITADSKTLNRWIGVIVACGTSLGISAHYDGSAGSLLVGGLNPGDLLHNGMHALSQWAIQQYTYDSAIAPQSMRQALAKAIESLQAGTSGTGRTP